MMTHLAEAVLWLSVGILWWIFYWPNRRYQLDRARFRLFEIRDRLFDAAVDGTHITFDDRAYGIVRVGLNGMLRSIERYGWVRMLHLLMQVMRDPGWRDGLARQEAEFEAALAALSPQGRRLAEEAMGEAHRVFADYMVRISLVMLVMYCAVRLVRPVRRWVARMLSTPAKLATHAVSYEPSLAGRGHPSHAAR